MVGQRDFLGMAGDVRMIEGIRRLRKYVCLHTHENVSGPSNDFDNSARPLDVLTIADAIEREIKKLKAENAKLRTQLADVTESMARVEERCAKLRELAAEAIRLMQANAPDCGLCKHYRECWTGEAMDYSPSGCVICNDARELGVEVKR